MHHEPLPDPLQLEGVRLAARRHRALADYLDTAASARDPGTLLAAHVGYWSGLVDDYTSAMGALMSANAIRVQAGGAEVVESRRPDAPAAE